MCVLSIKVPIRKKSGNLFNNPRIYIYIYIYIYTHTIICPLYIMIISGWFFPSVFKNFGGRLSKWTSMTPWYLLMMSLCLSFGLPALCNPSLNWEYWIFFASLLFSSPFKVANSSLVALGKYIVHAREFRFLQYLWYAATTWYWVFCTSNILYRFEIFGHLLYILFKFLCHTEGLRELW